MDITDSIAEVYKISPFAVMEERTENVIDVINYLTEKREHEPEKTIVKSTGKTSRRLVTEKNATGGWY